MAILRLIFTNHLNEPRDNQRAFSSRMTTNWVNNRNNHYILFGSAIVIAKAKSSPLQINSSCSDREYRIHESLKSSWNFISHLHCSIIRILWASIIQCTLIVLNTRIIVRAQLPIFPHEINHINKWMCTKACSLLKCAKCNGSEQWTLKFFFYFYFVSFISARINYVVVKIQIFMFFSFWICFQCLTLA